MKVAVVTGGRRGIGRGISYALAEAGFRVVIVDVSKDAAAEETLSGLQSRGSQGWLVQGDIGAIETRQELVDACFNAAGRVDCLVNNAGVQVAVRGDLLDVTPESYDRVMDINLRGTFFLTQAFARRMVSDPQITEGEARSIITISSANVYLAGPDRPEYCMSKTALAMMTKMFAMRLAAHGINTYEIRPGIIRTDMTAPAKEKYDRWIGSGLTPIARWGEPEDVARAVATLASNRLSFSTGDAFHIDGGLHIPKL